MKNAQNVALISKKVELGTVSLDHSVWLISIPTGRFPGGVRWAASLRCRVSSVTLIPEESPSLHSNQLIYIA